LKSGPGFHHIPISACVKACNRSWELGDSLPSRRQRYRCCKLEQRCSWVERNGLTGRHRARRTRWSNELMHPLPVPPPIESHDRAAFPRSCLDPPPASIPGHVEAGFPRSLGSQELPLHKRIGGGLELYIQAGPEVGSFSSSPPRLGEREGRRVRLPPEASLCSPFHSPSAAFLGQEAINGVVQRWARLGSNQRPPACEAGADRGCGRLEGTVERFAGPAKGSVSPPVPWRTHQNSPIGGSLTPFTQDATLRVNARSAEARLPLAAALDQRTAILHPGSRRARGSREPGHLDAAAAVAGSRSAD
jgi:hypothetical protein